MPVESSGTEWAAWRSDPEPVWPRRVHCGNRHPCLHPCNFRNWTCSRCTTGLASPPTGPTTRASASRYRRAGCPCHHPALQERQAVEGRRRRCRCAQRGTAGIEIPRSRALATMERISPPEPYRDENALCETVGSASHGAGLRPPGRGVPDSCCRAERLHRARHPRRKGRGISLSGRRAGPAVSLFVQQRRSKKIFLLIIGKRKPALAEIRFPCIGSERQNIHAAQQNDPKVLPERLPLTCGHPMRSAARSAPDGSIALWVRRDGGPVTMTGMAFA